MLCITNPGCFSQVGSYKVNWTFREIAHSHWNTFASEGCSLFSIMVSLPTDFLHSRIYLVAVPVPEKVDRSICPLLDNCPSSGVQAVLTPELYWFVAVFGFDHVNAAIGMPGFPGLLAVFEWTFWKRNTVSLQAWLCSAHCPGIFCNGKSVIQSRYKPTMKNSAKSYCLRLIVYVNKHVNILSQCIFEQKFIFAKQMIDFWLPTPDFFYLLWERFILWLLIPKNIMIFFSVIIFFFYKSRHQFPSSSGAPIWNWWK